MIRLKKTTLLFAALTLGAVLLRGQQISRQGEGIHLSYGYAMLLNAPEALTTRYSDSWQVQFVNEWLLSNYSHFALGYGLGFSTYNWHNNLRISTSPNSPVLTYSYLPADSSYNTNRFSGSYVDMPLELRYRSKMNQYGRYWRIYVGGLVGYRINSSSKFRVDDFSVKNYRITDLAQWQYGVFLRTGYYVFNLYAYYGLNPVFSQVAPGWEDLTKLRNLSIGLNISL